MPDDEDDDANTEPYACDMCDRYENAIRLLAAALLDCVLRFKSHGANAHDGECSTKRNVMFNCSCGLDALIAQAEALLAGRRGW